MEKLNNHNGIFSLLTLIIAILMMLGSLFIYFKKSGFSEGNVKASIESLSTKINKLENDYRLILTVLLKNNKAVASAIKQSAIPTEEKNYILQKFDTTSEQLKNTLMQEGFQLPSTYHDGEIKYPKN